jgi:hypothetical protein
MIILYLNQHLFKHKYDLCCTPVRFPLIVAILMTVLPPKKNDDWV